MAFQKMKGIREWERHGPHWWRCVSLSDRMSTCPGQCGLCSPRHFLGKGDGLSQFPIFPSFPGVSGLNLTISRRFSLFVMICVMVLQNSANSVQTGAVAGGPHRLLWRASCGCCVGGGCLVHLGSRCSWSGRCFGGGCNVGLGCLWRGGLSLVEYVARDVWLVADTVEVSWWICIIKDEICRSKWPLGSWWAREWIAPEASGGVMELQLCSMTNAITESTSCRVDLMTWPSLLFSTSPPFSRKWDIM